MRIEHALVGWYKFAVSNQRPAGSTFHTVLIG